MYEASCLGMNGGLELNELSCRGGPRESFTNGEEVDGSSGRRRIELTVIESDLPRVTLRKEGRGVESCWIALRASGYNRDHFAGQFHTCSRRRTHSMEERRS